MNTWLNRGPPAAWQGLDTRKMNAKSKVHSSRLIAGTIKNAALQGLLQGH